MGNKNNSSQVQNDRVTKMVNTIKSLENIGKQAGESPSEIKRGIHKAIKKDTGTFPPPAELKMLKLVFAKLKKDNPLFQSSSQKSQPKVQSKPQSVNKNKVKKIEDGLTKIKLEGQNNNPSETKQRLKTYLISQVSDLNGGELKLLQKDTAPKQTSSSANNISQQNSAQVNQVSVSKSSNSVGHVESSVSNVASFSIINNSSQSSQADSNTVHTVLTVPKSQSSSNVSSENEVSVEKPQKSSEVSEMQPKSVSNSKEASSTNNSVKSTEAKTSSETTTQSSNSETTSNTNNDGKKAVFHLGKSNRSKWKAKSIAHKYHVKANDLINLQGDGFQELQRMIGLKDVKSQISDYINDAMVTKHRNKLLIQEAQKEHKKLKPSKLQSLNMIFLGSPGTGKTVVARIVGKILFQYGVIQKPLFHECSAKDLVSSLVGGSAPKTDKAVKESLGGVLFIDEAYNLAPSESDGTKGNANSSKASAVSELLRQIENHRDNLIVIMAGYKKEMENLIENGNPGLRSRFNHMIDFPDYSNSEMVQILALHAKDAYYNIPSLSQDNIKNGIADFISYAKSQGDDSNGRLMRNLLQNIIECHKHKISGADKTTDFKQIKQNIQKLSLDDINNISGQDVADGTTKAYHEEANE